MRIITFAAFLVFTIFCIIVGVSNRGLIPFSLSPLPIEGEMPLYLVLFIGIFIGLGAGMMVLIIKSFKYAHQTRKQTKKIQSLEQQVKELTPPESATDHNQITE